MKFIFTLAICLSSIVLMAQQRPANQYILIVRSKAHITASAEAIKTNIEHWQAYMGELGRNGKITGGYRLPVNGVTISGKDKEEKPTSYIANDELVSSFIIIKAADITEAKQIAAKCPVFELDGNVEVKALQETAN